MKTKSLYLIGGNVAAKDEESLICWSCSVVGMHDTLSEAVDLAKCAMS